MKIKASRLGEFKKMFEAKLHFYDPQSADHLSQ